MTHVERQKRQAREWAKGDLEFTHFRSIPLESFSREELIGIMQWLGCQLHGSAKAEGQIRQGMNIFCECGWRGNEKDFPLAPNDPHLTWNCPSCGKEITVKDVLPATLFTDFQQQWPEIRKMVTDAITAEAKRQWPSCDLEIMFVAPDGTGHPQRWVMSCRVALIHIHDDLCFGRESERFEFDQRESLDTIRNRAIRCLGGNAPCEPVPPVSDGQPLHTSHDHMGLSRGPQ